MKTVCAWCGGLIADGDGPVTHGMCSACVKSFQVEDGVSLQFFIDTFTFPVLVLNDSLEPVGINKYGAESAHVTFHSPAKFSFGAIVECDRSKLPEGCGQTVHCAGCVLRRTLEETNATGRSFSMVPAKLTVGSQEVAMYISTLKLEGRVFVKLEKVQH